MDCLITKLKGTVNDGSLPKLGSMLFKLRTTTKNLVKIEAIGKDVSFSSADGSNVFSTSSGGEEKTNVINVGESNTIFYVDASKGVIISIDNKYNLEKLDVYRSTDTDELTVDLNFEDLKYCKKLSRLALTYMTLTGDISAFQNLTALTTIDLSSTQVTGDISAFQNLTALTTISLYSTNVTGSLDSLANLPSVLVFDMGNKTLTGDYFKFLNEHTNSDVVCSGNFNYTTKSWSGKSYRRIGGDDFTCNNLDNFLNDFQFVSVSSTNSSVSPAITMLGTRTTASDAAISTLQGKGFTVTVPEATDSVSVMTMAARGGAENFGIAYKDGQLVVGPVDLSKQKIYPASGVTVETFATKEEAERFIKDKGLNTERNIFWPNI